MKYNDNFILPPESVLKKMREDYKTTIAKAQSKEGGEVEKLQVSFLPQNIYNNLYRSNFYRQQLRQATRDTRTRQRLDRLIDRTDRNIDRFSGFFGRPTKAFVPPRIGVSKDYCQLLREIIIAEVDAIMHMFELLREGQSQAVREALYEIIGERLDVLKEVTILLSGCNIRRF